MARFYIAPKLSSSHITFNARLKHYKFHAVKDTIKTVKKSIKVASKPPDVIVRKLQDNSKSKNGWTSYADLPQDGMSVRHEPRREKPQCKRDQTPTIRQ